MRVRPAGTAWLWARAGLADSVDTLFVDEAGLYAESTDADTVISFITAHSRRSLLRAARSRIRCRCQSVRPG